MDSEGFAGFFTDTPMYQFGNGEPCLNKSEIYDSVANFFAAVDALYHDIRNVWEIGDAVFVEMDVTYWRHDGTSITLPCSDIFRFKGHQIEELRIYMDANPFGDASQPVGQKASVFTMSEGRRAQSRGIMRRYFSEHAEGVYRAANGYAPKWASAGPKWPMAPKIDILNAFQGALTSGDWNSVYSYLTEDAVLRIGNRPEVFGPQAILDTLGDLFTHDLKATGATYTGVWDTPDNALVVEMVVQGTRLGDGRAVSYPCVETYRFEGQQISEWRIYPLEPALLAAEY